MAYTSFEDLAVWKRSARLAVRVYDALRDCRDYGLKDQMTRAAVSIASNIAEGAERNSKAEYVRFLHIAKGSAAELRTQMYIAQRIGIFSDPPASALVAECKEVSAMLHGLIKSFKPKTSIFAQEPGDMDTWQKLDILKQACADEAELDQIVRQLLGMTLGQHQRRCERYAHDLQAFETRYSMDSATFYRRFEAGELGDAMDFFEWAGLYELRQDLLEKIRRVESVV